MERKRIMLYGLNDSEITLLVKTFPQCDFTYADIWTDILAIPAELVIADLRKTEEENVDVIFDYYKQIEPSPEQIIITGINGEYEKIKSVQIADNFFESEQTVRTMVLSALHDTARDVDFSRRMVITLDIMRKICNHPGITTKKLAEIEELSERSIKRYIDTLRMAGAIIEYHEKGWHCEMAIWDY